ncbi:MAG: 16S rRNA (guanine(527)-N(7))-methyltransferase RsmG [Clostridiales bacterium]|jgi:16S rRNA (guanine527-N7)-methyltransferase|nr:16S rRNA (guanine(527)-N(7))-methyltransferase RsmG [Clostridiales bacterium]
MELLKRALDKMEIDSQDDLIEKFRIYRDLVLKWNEKVNLTAIKDLEEFEEKHFVDSLICYSFHAFKKADRIIDIGTGAGFPGLVLAICYPEKEFVLVDSLNKRIKILDEIIDILSVKNVRTIHSRAEDLAKDKKHREKYDVSLARAVAHLSVLSEYCLPFVKVGGYFGAYKSGSIDDELDESRKAIKILGGRYKDEISQENDLINLDHKIVWILKSSNSPAKYPRKAGLPSKKPIV